MYGYLVCWQSVLAGRAEQLKCKERAKKTESDFKAQEKDYILKEVGNFRSELESKKDHDLREKKKYAQELKKQMEDRQRTMVRI